ncbi:MAG: WG repeat-containing protein [Spirochaetales bacterium]|nr:WG repeat-containing protein [Spirochaetales bacterium]
MKTKCLFGVLIVSVLCFSSCLTMMSELADSSKEEPAKTEQIEAAMNEDEYAVWMLGMVQYYLDTDCVNEANYLLSDLEGQTALYNDEITALRTKINSHYSPEAEDSIYNSDVLRRIKYYNGKYGYIDSRGNWVIEARFDRAEEFSDGLALVTIKDKRFFIDREGNTVLEEKAWDDLYFADAQKKTVLLRDRNINYTEIPYEGTYELPFDRTRFKFLGGFHDGLARCSIKTDLAETSDSEYVSGRSGFVYINKTGDEVFFLPDGNLIKYYKEQAMSPHDFSDGLALVEFSFWGTKKDLYGYIDTKGSKFIEPQFDKAFDFQNGMACVMYPNTKKYGFIDTTGRGAIKPSYHKSGELYFFSDGVITYHDSERGVYQYDTNGVEILDNWDRSGDEADYVRRLTPHQNGLTGVIVHRGDYPDNYDIVMYLDKNKTPAIVLAPSGDDMYNKYKQYDDISTFSNGRAFIRFASEYWGVIDLRGNFVIPLQNEWSYKGPFYNGLAPIDMNGNTAYINRSGEIVYSE